MKGFIETAEHAIRVNPSEPEAGGSSRIAITSVVVEHKGHRLELPLAAQSRDFTGTDSDWRLMNLVTAILMISADQKKQQGRVVE